MSNRSSILTLRGPIQELKTKVRPSIVSLCSILIAVLPSLGQDHPLQQSHLPQPLTAASNSESLKEELVRVQMEMSQIAQDMDAIDVQMMPGIANKALSGTSKLIPKVHELLRDHGTSRTVQGFLDSPRSDIKWELCLKTGKLYVGLFEMIFEMSKEGMRGDEKTQTASSIADESIEVVQLVFLARVMTELELRYSELQSQLMVKPDVKQQELWRRLSEALQNDDRTYMEKLNALLAKTSMSPGHFAARVISDVQKTRPKAATAVIEGMGIVNPEGDNWRLADIPGINPDFIQALQCDRKAMKDFFAGGSNTALVEACSCRKYADGSHILAFAAKPADPAKSTDLVGKSPSSTIRLPQDPDVFRLPKGDLTRGPLTPEKGDMKAGAQQRRGENTGTTFTLSAKPQPKIPSWWIRCECPDDHPDAGMVVDGVRWHAPVLRCPNPELRRLEVK
jgi:hypothetical protein